MNKLLIQDVVTGETLDLIDTAENIQYSTSMYDQPGKLEFTVHHRRIYSEGSPISFVYDNQNIFFGYLFKQSRSDETVKFTAYDQMRYLKNKDTLAYSGLTASGIFTDICKKFKLKHKVVNPSKYVVPPFLNRDKTLFEMINNGIDATYMAESKLYFIMDNFGTLEFVDVEKKVTDLIVDKESLMLEYDYERGIDDETYNQVKVVRENKETKKRDVWMVKDTNTQKRWGILQHLHTADEKMNEAQIKELAQNILKLKNRPEETVSIKCIGSPTIKAGVSFRLNIDGIMNKLVYCKSVTLRFEDNCILMDCEVALGGGREDS